MICSLRKLTPTFMSSTASRALLPCSGLPAAWAVLPRKWNLTALLALLLLSPPTFMALGWWLSTASTPSNTPSRTIQTLPLSISSAGHPKNLTVPLTPAFSMAYLRAMAPPSPEVPWMLWPQPWPGSPSFIGSL